MIKLQRILVPTDFSAYSEEAMTYACAFAEQFEAELHVVHVLQDLVGVVPDPGVAFPPPGDYMGELQASAEKALLQMPAPEWAAKHTVVRATRQGPPFLEIVRYAKELEIDLIDSVTHGRGGLAHVLLGSVAERVFRKAPCPVLTVRPGEHEFVMP